MSEEKEFWCTVRDEPCECDKKGCVTKRDPLERIADSLESIAGTLAAGALNVYVREG